MTHILKRGGRPFVTVSLDLPEIPDAGVSSALEKIAESCLVHCEMEADRMYDEYLADTDPHKRFRLRAKRMTFCAKILSDDAEFTEIEFVTDSHGGKKSVTQLKFRRVRGHTLLFGCENLQQGNNI